MKQLQRIFALKKKSMPQNDQRTLLTNNILITLS